MSNIDTWWDATPPELQEAVRTVQTRRLVEEEKNNNKKSEDENGRMQQPTGLRVVAPDVGGSSSISGGPISGR
jgi:hypothetical protein